MPGFPNKHFVVSCDACLRGTALVGKLFVRRRGIRRGRFASPWRLGRRSVVTRKVEKHCKIMMSKLRVEGLFNWAKVARLFHEAGLPMQSATVPVERLWSNYVDYFPDAARGMTLEWWQLLNQLGYMRFNYRHFNRATLPTFTRGDALLSERIENQVMLTRALSSDPGSQATAVLRELQAAMDA